MGIPEDYQGRHFYHFTHIDNLDSILKNGFLSTNTKDQLGLQHINIAAESIQGRRSLMDVTCGSKGKVHDYVPFYFASRNPMALALVNSKNFDQIDLIYFAVPIAKLIEDHVVFTDASANTAIPPNFYNNPENLDELNWKAIESKKWSNSDDTWKHQRMAEALIHETVPPDWIEYIIVWNKKRKEIVENCFKSNNLSCPKITYEPKKGNYFYYTKFALGRGDESLVTGPNQLKNLLDSAIEGINKYRTKVTTFNYPNIESLLAAIEEDFTCLEELKGIYKLETINDVHDENVSDHTVRVKNNLEGEKFFEDLNDPEKQLVQLAAYLHDIGKGPAKKWKDGKQPSYPDHPADSLKLLVRILIEDIKDLSEESIEILCKLVAYHDLLGDIVGRNRNQKELFSIFKTEEELSMLIALSLADIKSIDENWFNNLQDAIPQIIKEFKQNLKC